MKKRFIVTLKNGNTYDMTVEEVDASAAVTVDAPAAPAAPKAAPAPAPKAAAAAGSVAVKAPLQGTVMKVNVKPGDTVTKGAPVAVIEALMGPRRRTAWWQASMSRAAIPSRRIRFC